MTRKKSGSSSAKSSNKSKSKGAAPTSRTKMIHGASVTSAWNFSRHLIPPITANTTFRLESLRRGADGFIAFGGDGSGAERILVYDRLDEPNTLMLEEQLASMEGTDIAVAFGSGMGAISSAIMSVVKAGHKIIAHRTLYGCSYSLMTDWLPRFGVDTEFIDINDGESRAKLLEDPNVRVVYFESVSNPTLDLADMPAIVKDVEKANKKRKPADKIVTIVDNTFATPWGLRPHEWGIDVVVHSLTKNISGFGTEMGGAVMASRALERSIKLARKDFGAIINSRSAWNINVHGIPTLSLRFSQQQANALAVSKFLESHSKVERVIYPGLKGHPQYKLAKKLLRTPDGEFAPGTMVAFTVKGNMRKCEKFVDLVAKNSYSITLAVSLGVTKTLIEVPGFMTHSVIPTEKQASSGIDPRLIRLSLGLEDKADLIGDLKAALEKI